MCGTQTLIPEHLRRTHEVLGRLWPEQAREVCSAELSDPEGWHVGRITARAREPVGTLPSGTAVLGMADAILLNEPTTPGQGANTASKAASFYLQRILERGDVPFEAAWMWRVGGRLWSAWSRWVALWTESMIEPFPAHIRDLFAAAQELPGLGSEIAMRSTTLLASIPGGTTAIKRRASLHGTDVEPRVTSTLMRCVGFSVTLPPALRSSLPVRRVARWWV